MSKVNSSLKARFSLIPRYMYRNLTDIPLEFFDKHGIRFLMLDIDNTIASYAEHEPAGDVLQWFNELRGCGITPFLISNSKRAHRVGAFSKALDAGFIMKAGKPSPDGLHSAMRTAGFNAGISAFIGDQIITDTLAANRAGVLSVIVHPRRFTNPFLAFRYLLELPFRFICYIRTKGGNPHD